MPVASAPQVPGTVEPIASGADVNGEAQDLLVGRDL